jgi:signal transduction histidine kinase
MERIRGGVGTLVRMIDDLLDVALIDLHRLTIKPQRLDFTQIVEEIVDRCRPSLGDHRVEVTKPAGASIVTADPDRLGQLLGNLLSNAAKYGAPGSDIEVRVTRSDGEVEVAVRNHGEGLRPDEAARVFERFHRTEGASAGAQRGLGLGLYIARGIVEGHGGRIGVESTPGESTTFRFWLPAGCP